jgi:hypothetical protein
VLQSIPDVVLVLRDALLTGLGVSLFASFAGVFSPAGVAATDKSTLTRLSTVSINAGHFAGLFTDGLAV